jgi:hypothetical protein
MYQNFAIKPMICMENDKIDRNRINKESQKRQN